MLALFKRLFGSKELPEDLSYSEARAVLESRKGQLERELASRFDAEPEMLYYLAERGEALTRRHVAANPATPAAANRILAEDVDGEVRAELAQKIGRLLPDLLASERERVCEITLETLQKLATDQLPRVRAILAENVKTLDCVPKPVIDALAHDAEETVSVPILEYSPLLSDSDLLEIVASARARNALAAVARRRGLSEEVSDAIVASLDTGAVAALLSNPNAHVREGTFEKIIERAQSIKSWHAPLAMRSDLSLRALRRVAGFVAASLIEQIAARHDLDEETRSHLKRSLRARVEKDAAEAASTDEDKIHAQAMRAKDSGELDESFVESAMEVGNRDLVIESFAVLVGMPRSTIEKVFASRSSKAITALAWKAGLSMRVAFKIQTAIGKLHADELLPARAGVAFPLSEDEMRWHLSYFGFSGAKTAT
jgi:uncharacterized protein (DUF2336 family)